MAEENNRTVSSFQSLHGAYMTDLCLDMQSQSMKVTIDAPEAISRLEEQLRVLASSRFHVVCFGHAVFRTLSTVTPTAVTIQDGIATAEVVLGSNLSLSCYRVIHYSYAVRYKRAERFTQKLKQVNDIIGNTKG